MGCSWCLDGCSPTRSIAARDQVHRKGMEAEGYAINGISVGGHETCVTMSSLNVTFNIGRGSLFAMRQAHLDRIAGDVQAAWHLLRPKPNMPLTSTSSSTPSSQKTLTSSVNSGGI